MISLRGRAATYGEVWYEETPPAGHAADIMVFRQQPAPIPHSRHVPFLSLVSDLSGDDASITAAFSKECRYEIRRADAKDGLATEFIAKPREALPEFAAFYAAFAEQKTLAPIDGEWLEVANSAGRLLLTTAVHDGERLVWHAYLMCGRTARLMHSASLFRTRDPSFRSLVGRANRWLHWRDMMSLRSEGSRNYDWGGMFADESTPERAGINRFKRSFGGVQVRTYDCTVGISLRGRIYLPLRDAWRTWKRPNATPPTREKTCQPC